MDKEINSENKYEFKRKVTLFDGIMLVSGVMIGSGIFLTSAEISRTVGGMGWLLLVWIIGGIMTVIGASSYGELAALYPKAGGQYVYLHEAYNPFISFLYGWSFFTVISTGLIAAVAVAFAKYFAVIFPFLSETNYLLSIGSFNVSYAQIIAIISIVILSYINTKGINQGRIIQTSFTVIKVVAVLFIVVLGIIMLNSDVLSANWENAWDMHYYLPDSESLSGYSEPEKTSGLYFAGLFCVAMVGALFSSDAWNSVSSIAAEVKNPKKNVGRSLLLGTLTVTILYVFMNFVYASVLPMENIALAPADRVGAEAAEFMFGTKGAVIISILILISTFGCNNGLILSGSRVFYSMANDKLFFKKAGKLNKNGVPAYAIWLQCIWASVLCLSGGYSALLNYLVFVVLLFYILTIAGVFILRKKHPEMERTVRAPGYPVLPLIYIICATIICVALFILRPINTWPGLVLVLLGIPFYFLIKGNSKK